MVIKYFCFSTETWPWLACYLALIADLALAASVLIAANRPHPPVALAEEPAPAAATRPLGALFGKPENWNVWL